MYEVSDKILIMKIIANSMENWSMALTEGKQIQAEVKIQKVI